jgi:hypothetical protein
VKKSLTEQTEQNANKHKNLEDVDVNLKFGKTTGE